VLTHGSDDNLLGTDKRVPLFSLIAGYRYRSQAVLDEDAGPSSPAEIELLETPEELTGLPGTRVPHLWLQRQGRRISTLDLLDGRFVLLVGPAGTPWQTAAAGVAGSLGIDLVAHRLGADGDLLDLEDGWRAKLGMSAEGAVLVRPDGFVAWRTSTLPASPERRLEQVISSILCRSRVGPPLRPATAEARPLR
jgi:putative polyketide hydroxylase